MSYVVHYTILDPKGTEKHMGVAARRLTAGPYATFDEALASKQMFEGADQQAINVYIEEK